MEKAYDLINREKLFKLLTHRGIHQDITELIRKMYEGTRMKFTLGQISTQWIQNNRGVKQGCVMSPLLFNTYIEELLTRIRVSRRGARIGNKTIGCLAFADDLVIIGEKREDMEELLRITSEYGEEWQVKFSANKCEVMKYNSRDEGQWKLGDSILEVVENYKYLGIEVSNEGIGGARQRKINEGKARKVSGMIYNSGQRI